MRTLTTILLVCFTMTLFSQTTTIEGYIYESGNRGFISGVSVTAENMTTDKIVDKAKSDNEGKFIVTVPINSKIRLYAAKDMFDIKRIETEVGTGKAFVKMEMGRAPGYTFEVTLAEKRSSPNTVADAITGTRIEVYNNTTRQSVMDLKDHDNPEFQLNLQKGNHYTILIRKNGFLSKRMEAKVDVEGCILCFEGIGRVDPGVSDNLTEDNAFGVLLANVELERIFEGKTMEIQNLYYDVNKYALTGSARSELAKVITLMKDNPNLTLELGSHTDSRGTSESNLELSNKRAKSAVNYLIQKGGIAKNRIISKGYGENMLLNKCGNGIECSESEHAINRRTELKIVGITDIKEVKSLAAMKKEEQLEAEILGLMDQEQIQAKDEEELRRIIEADKKVAIDVERQIEEKELDTKTEVIEDSVIGEEKEEEAEQAEQAEGTEINETAIEAELGTDMDVSKVPVDESIIEKEPVDASPTSQVTPSPKDGVRVILFISKIKLAQDHFIITRHKNVEIYDNGDGRFFYMIGGFPNESAAFKYLNTFIKPDKKYKGCGVVKFKNGLMAAVNQ